MPNELDLHQETPVQAGIEPLPGIFPGGRSLFAALILFVLAAASNRILGPWAAQLPANYSSETVLAEDNRFRDTSNGDWQTSTLTVKRIDQTITVIGPVQIIEGSVHAYFSSGDINFETTNLFGVDRVTHLNLPVYGDSERDGQYLFPPHVQPGRYTVWDPIFIGPRQAAFLRSDVIDGLPVYVFQLTASALDETAGYTYLPEVPERFLAHTDGTGTAWVEPVSGIEVNYEDTSVSYFVEPVTGAHKGDFNQWTERFTPQTIAAQLKIAREERLKILVLEIWLPVMMLASGLVCLVRAGFWFARRRPVIPPQEMPE